MASQLRRARSSIGAGRPTLPSTGTAERVIGFAQEGTRRCRSLFALDSGGPAPNVVLHSSGREGSGLSRLAGSAPSRLRHGHRWQAFRYNRVVTKAFDAPASRHALRRRAAHRLRPGAPLGGAPFRFSCPRLWATGRTLRTSSGTGSADAAGNWAWRFRGTCRDRSPAWSARPGSGEPGTSARS